MHTFLQKTAWTMVAPRPYSPFHLGFCGIGVILVGFLVHILSRKCSKMPYMPLYICGLVLALGELYKQLFLYQIVNQGRYDWWYFPMQLCSTPMYLCIILIFMHKNSSAARTVCTYLQDFSLLGGVMALVEPSGLMQPYVTLTVHGLTWHLILIFIGLYCRRCNLSGKGWHEYAKTLPLLTVFLAVASIINVVTHGQADMFYISPFYPVTQVFFYQVSLLIGTAAGIGLYVFAICLGGWIIHYCLGKL